MIAISNQPISADEAAKIEAQLEFSETGESQWGMIGTVPGWKVFKSEYAKDKAFSETANEYPLKFAPFRDAGDAFRHAVLSIRLVRGIGARDTKRLEDAHERDVPSSGADARGDRLMDLVNNHNARMLGLMFPHMEPAKLARLALATGLLKTSIYEIRK